MVLGIDLGTTHCALASARADRPVELFPIPQVVSPGEVAERPLLPSFLYAPLPNEPCPLPWDETPSMVAGVFAQRRGGETLGRMVASAKSWLSYAGVDRTSALLPPNAPEGVRKISPVAASAAYLAHLREAWDSANPDAPLHEQRVVIGVPASFDSVARELTLEAARDAGYPDVILLEEPQAAFYAWIERHEDWRDRIRVGDVILVIDIGGGTTDFTLIAVTEAAGELKLDRIAVGDHILLGGDNMDLALARHVAESLAAKGTKLDALQFQALWQQCRAAKEKLLDPAFEADEQPVTILGRGSGLVGGAIRAKLSRAEVQSLLVDGFLPRVERDARPAKARRAGLAEIGLPYASDAAITRHLAEFLARAGGPPPTKILFNGGVLRGAAIRARVLEVLNSWLPQAAQPLEGDDLMHAVARGAAYYGLAREGRGVRIRGGISKTYYVGIETSVPAVPGMPAPMKALAVAPFGMEEGASHQFPDQQFGLYVGEPAEFRFFSSSRHDEAGAILEEIPDELAEMPPMEVTLTGEAGLTPVTLESHVSETGMLELYCVARDGRRWKLSFNVRERVTP
jgi:molecular chaperone DnaK (HSP70)